MAYKRNHMGINLEGMLRNHKHKSMKGFFLDDKGNEMSDKECREYIAECQAKGWKKIPMCADEECPDFDRFELWHINATTWALTLKVCLGITNTKA